jgi:hypothetical protein
VLRQRAGRLHFFRHLGRVFEQAGAELGEHQLAGGALQQPLAEPRFEQGNAARYG